MGVSSTTLCVFRIVFGTSEEVYRAKVLTYLSLPSVENPDIETATITQDSHGVWWVAADVGQAIYVWSSENGIDWSPPLLMGKKITTDDISCITSLKNSTIVLWSDQNGEAVCSREHIDGRSTKNWSHIKIVQSGGETADDHINTALSAKGTLWVTTKNSIDSVDYPQFVLRVRDPEGNWKNFPYFLRKKTPQGSVIPTRPIVISTPDPHLILSGNTINDWRDRHKNRIVFGRIDTTSSKILTDRKTVIAPKASMGVIVNNVTGPKAMFPQSAPWIILASDDEGNVYEADLKLFFRNLN